jgi:hypothetical protein
MHVGQVEDYGEFVAGRNHRTGQIQLHLVSNLRKFPHVVDSLSFLQYDNL